MVIDNQPVACHAYLQAVAPTLNAPSGPTKVPHLRRSDRGSGDSESAAP